MLGAFASHIVVRQPEVAISKELALDELLRLTMIRGGHAVICIKRQFLHLIAGI